MSLRMNLWKVDGDDLSDVPLIKLDYEERLEKWIQNDSTVLGIDLLMIGSQVPTEFGGRIDLLGISREGDLAIIELKRDRTPRDIVAQVLDYATWVRMLTYKEVNVIASEHLGKSLSAAYVDYFGQAIPENINVSHSMVVVSPELDEASQRIIEYLAEEHNLNINAVFFNFFKADDKELLGRAWLMDPTQVQERTEARRQAPWSGYWFVNVGEGPHRNWEDNRRYGYIGAGQGSVYSNALKRVSEGDEIFAYMATYGYVGYGKVTEEAVMIKDFIVEEKNKPLLDLDLRAPKASENQEKPDLSEWVVGIDWQKTFAREESRSFKGIFANPNVVCKLRHEPTVEFLKSEFEVGQN